MIVFTDDPFCKYSYGDFKGPANDFEVMAIMLAAKKSEVEAWVIDACGHAFYVQTKANHQLLVKVAERMDPEEVLVFAREWGGSDIWGLFVDEAYVEYAKKLAKGEITVEEMRDVFCSSGWYEEEED